MTDRLAAVDAPLVLALDDGPVRSLTLNRPQARNSLVWDLWVALDDALGAAEADALVRVVVLDGAGGYFCAGGDRKTPPARGRRALGATARLDLGHRVLRRLSESPLVVVAAVEGGAVGLGWSLALACDVIVAADDAVFASPFVSLGLVPDGAIAWRLVRQLGRPRAGALLLEGGRLGAVEAAASGLVSRTCAPGTAASTARAYGGVLAAQPANALELTKRLVRTAETAPLPDFVAQEIAFATLTQAAPTDRRPAARGEQH